ncbi:PREDICTED: uncharacterized protein LOC106298728 isoform X3 [Brassica oleracea var. oleracea]|uniref:uncharacterized protein LOC106298728 isoform X3 n=1 Tax=Brassica oleracea var. oleracea TaxID=109376 RepID=UPI0006A73F38|nr:PREDICTED: uncharacterized protein LOC106298728 isoform X3 [Brassica oleracea var. oleracea]
MIFFSLNAPRSYTDLSFSKFITFFLSNIMMMTLAASVSCLSLSRTATVTSCKHEYHLKRDIEWSQRSRECSICWQLFVLKDPARTIYLLASSVHQVLRRELDMVENEKKECISNFSKGTS